MTLLSLEPLLPRDASAYCLCGAPECPNFGRNSVHSLEPLSVSPLVIILSLMDKQRDLMKPESSLCCLVSQKPASLSKHLVYVEFAHNTLVLLLVFQFPDMESEVSIPSAKGLDRHCHQI